MMNFYFVILVFVMVSASKQLLHEGQLDDYRLSLTATDLKLTILAESLLNCKQFSTQISEELASSISGGLFQSTQALYQGMSLAVDKGDPLARIRLTEDARLCVSLMLSF
jgi:hypothetical protein